jgi:hypothetical protein
VRAFGSVSISFNRSGVKFFIINSAHLAIIRQILPFSTVLRLLFVLF